MVSPRIWIGCAVGENAQQGVVALAQRLTNDLRQAGAEVISESFALPDEQLLPVLQQELASCQWFVLVQTPQGMGSGRAQLALQEAISRFKGGLLRGVCLVNASSNEWDGPPTWSEMKSYVYNGDYPRLRDKLLLDLGLLQITGLLGEGMDDATGGMLPPFQQAPGFQPQYIGNTERPAPFHERSGELYKTPFQQHSGELYRAPSAFQVPASQVPASSGDLQQTGSMASKGGTRQGDRPVAPPLFSMPKPSMPSRRFWLFSVVSVCMAVLIVSGVVLAKDMASTTSSVQKTPVAVTHLPSNHPTPTQAAPTQTAPVQSVPTQAVPTQPPSNVLVQDTFQRANQAHWGTASDGLAWSLDGATSPALSIVNGTGQVVDADANAPAGTKTTYLTIIGPSAGNVDVEASAVVNKFATGAPTTTVDLVNFGVVARWQNNNMYKALIDGQELYIFKYINDEVVRPPLASVPFAAQAGVAYTIRFEAVGAILQAKAWPSNQAEPANWMVSVADNSYPQGQGGMRFAVQPGTQINVLSFQETAI